MFVVRSPVALLGQCLLGIKRSCIRLIATACDPYRLERHYMRGPGPKCLAKHGVVPTAQSFGAQQTRAHWTANSEIFVHKLFISLLPPLGFNGGSDIPTMK